MDRITKLQSIEKKFNDNKILKAKLEQKQEQTEIEIKKNIEELEAKGVKENDLLQTLQNLEIETDEALAVYEEKLK